MRCSDHSASEMSKRESLGSVTMSFAKFGRVPAAKVPSAPREVWINCLLVIMITYHIQYLVSPHKYFLEWLIEVDISYEYFYAVVMFMNEQKAQNKIRKSFGVLLRSFLLVCVLVTYGGGSSLLQGVAWVSMLPGQIASSDSFEEGVTQTFNGENPCPLCEMASKLREIESGTSAPEQSSKTSKQVEVVEKIVHSSCLIQCVSPASSLVLLDEKLRNTLLRISLEVDIPPPDFV